MKAIGSPAWMVETYIDARKSMHHALNRYVFTHYEDANRYAEDLKKAGQYVSMSSVTLMPERSRL